MSLEETLLGRIIQFNDGDIRVLTPVSYDTFFKAWDFKAWNEKSITDKYGYQSDTAYESFLRTHSFRELEHFNDETLDEGFRVLPLTANMRLYLKLIQENFALFEQLIKNYKHEVNKVLAKEIGKSI